MTERHDDHDPGEGRRIVVGVGNRDRGDDAVGPMVCDELTVRLGSDRWAFGPLELWVVEGDPSTLAVRWRPDDRVVVVDAVVTGAAPGTIHVVDADGLGVGRPVSTHGIGVAETIALSTALGTRPLLTVVGVEAASFDHGAPATPSVAAAIASVTDLVVDLLSGALDTDPAAGSD